MTRTLRTLAASLVALTAVLAALIVPASPVAAAATITVMPGMSIQAAIDGAAPGDTIMVQPGTYTENLTITKNNIKLVAWGATLLPPATPVSNGCQDPAHPGEATGLCIVGDFTHGQGPPVLKTPVVGVEVTGLTVRNFSGIGIFSLGSDGSRLIGNKLYDNGAYGIFANTATHTFIAFNTAAFSGEAGIYVGDSPNADAFVVLNNSFSNTFGVFVRNAEHGALVRNYVHDNCVGVLFLADAPGPAGSFTVARNTVAFNNHACPPGSDGTPPLSGIGILLAGAHNVNVTDINFIVGNKPSSDVPFSGGVVLVQGGPTGTAPANNTTHFNVSLFNAPDLFSDGSGAGNTFGGNFCQSSIPAGLCH